MEEDRLEGPRGETKVGFPFFPFFLDRRWWSMFIICGDDSGERERLKEREIYNAQRGNKWRAKTLRR